MIGSGFSAARCRKRTTAPRPPQLTEWVSTVPTQLEGRIIFFATFSAKPGLFTGPRPDSIYDRRRFIKSCVVFDPKFWPGIESREVAYPTRRILIHYNRAYALGLEHILQIENNHPVFVGKQLLHFPLAALIFSYAALICCVFSVASIIICSGKPLDTSLSG